MSHHQMHAKEFLIGAVVGSLLGSVSAILIAPKSGSMLRKDICDTYCNLSHKTHELADRGRSIAKGISCQTCDWKDKAKSLVTGAKDAVKGWVSEEEIEEEHIVKDLLIGGVVGGIIGAAVGLLLAPKPGEELREDIVDTYEEIRDNTKEFADEMTKKGKNFAKETKGKVNKWLDLAKNIVEEFTDEAQEKGEEWIDDVKGLSNNRRVKEILDWAHLGYKTWKGLSSKKRR